MDFDAELLARAIANSDPSVVVRIYEWSAPALSVGKNFDVDEATRRRCEAAGVELVRRPTGGGAVLHRHDVTYSVVAPDTGGGVMSTYRYVAQGLLAAFKQLGIDAEVIEHSARPNTLACFASPTGADIAVGGRKICGSAQLRRDGFFLQQGSIPLRDIRRETAELLRSSEQDDSGWIQLFRPETNAAELKEALARGFEKLWGPAERDILHPAASSLPNPLGLV